MNQSRKRMHMRIRDNTILSHTKWSLQVLDLLQSGFYGHWLKGLIESHSITSNSKATATATAAKPTVAVHFLWVFTMFAETHITPHNNPVHMSFRLELWILYFGTTLTNGLHRILLTMFDGTCFAADNLINLTTTDQHASWCCVVLRRFSI